MAIGQVCIVAIVRDELRFIDEWLAYHRLLGVDHFFLYDDDREEHLARHLIPHTAYVTVIRWYGRHEQMPGRNKQTKAYNHALSAIRERFRWVCFLDVDEFIVLRRCPDVHDFLDQFADGASVSLFWRIFGHNGYFNDPEGLVTASLTRRRRQSGRQYKSFTRTDSIASVESAHQCVLTPGCRRFDANRERFHSQMFERDPDGEYFAAYVNHYYCRSFRHWMNRPSRGATTDGENLHAERWKTSRAGCLRRFVESVAVDFNEYPDRSLAAFAEPIDGYLAALRTVPDRAPQLDVRVDADRAAGGPAQPSVDEHRTSRVPPPWSGHGPGPRSS